MKRLTFAMLALAGMSVNTGCDWRKLDQAVERAPVLSVGAPSGYSATDVGRLIVALPPGDDPAISARFFVAATTRTSAALVEINAEGKATTTNVPGATWPPTVSGQTFTSAALVTRPDEAYPSVLLGMANQKDLTGLTPGAFARIHIRPDRSFTMDTPVGPPLGPTGLFNPTGAQHFGRGVATGNVSGQPTFDDWVVVSDYGVALYEDGAVNLPPVVTPPTECQLAVDTIAAERLYQNSRNPAIGDFIPGAPGGEIAVGVTRVVGGSVVLLTRVDTGLACPMAITVPGLPSFGTTVAGGDVNGDGVLDLVVGAPAAPAPQVFVFFGPFDPAVPAVPSVVINAPAGTQNSLFGARLALADLDGQVGLEIAVAAPKFPAGGVQEAGAVYLFNAAGAQLPQVLADQDPTEFANLGEALTVMPFRNAGCVPTAVRPLLVAGADEEVFTYFALPGLLSEPRCFPAP